MRKTFTAEFKAKVGLEAMRGEKTGQEIGMLYEVHTLRFTPLTKFIPVFPAFYRLMTLR